MVSTKLGKLYVKEINDPNYPGIMIGLERNCVRYEFAWLEVDQSADNERPVLKVHAFDSQSEEPVFDLDISEAYVKELWNEFD